MQATAQPTNKPLVLWGIVIVLLLLLLATTPFVYQMLALNMLLPRFLASRLFYWGCLLFAWYYATNKEKQPLVLWPEKKQPFWVYLVSIFAIYFIIAIGSFSIRELFMLAGIKTDQVRLKLLLALMKGRYWLMFITSATAAFVEELIFRAYFMSRMALLFGSPYVAILVSSVLFGLLHFGYHNWLHIAVTFFIGLVLAVHYFKFQNIKILILFHFLYDFGLTLAYTR